MDDLTGKTFIITGAAGGIGRETVEMLSIRNADLLLIDIDEDRLREVQNDLSGRGSIDIAASNLKDPDACAEVLHSIGGPIHGMIHLAGLFVSDAMSPDDRYRVYNPVMAANVDNAYDLTIACLPKFDPNHVSRIVFASSLAFRRGAVNHTAYSAAKGAIVGMTRSLSRRLAPDVLVNCVAPGLIETQMTKSMLTQGSERRAEMLATVPLQRFGHPKEVAQVINFLCSDAASYISGQTINIDGGMITS